MECGDAQVNPKVGMSVKMLPGLEDQGLGKVTKVYTGKVDVGLLPRPSASLLFLTAIERAAVFLPLEWGGW
jgi:hypothetical protein